VWQYNFDYLCHSSHKYIDKYNKNGKTVYVYDKDGSIANRYNHPISSVILKSSLSRNSSVKNTKLPTNKLEREKLVKDNQQIQKDKNFLKTSKKSYLTKSINKEKRDEEIEREGERLSKYVGFLNNSIEEYKKLSKDSRPQDISAAKQKIIENMKLLRDNTQIDAYTVGQKAGYYLKNISGHDEYKDFNEAIKLYNKIIWDVYNIRSNK